jgi:hypothetical protein
MLDMGYELDAWKAVQYQIENGGDGFDIISLYAKNDLDRERLFD